MSDERKWNPITPIAPMGKADRASVPVKTVDQIKAERAAESWASIYLPNIALYGGRIHHLDGGIVHIEFKDMHSAVSFITWGSLNVRATFGAMHESKPFLHPVIIKIDTGV